MPYELRPAGEDDALAIWGLIREAVGWLRSIGSDQWSTADTWAGPTGKVTRAISAGHAWVLLDGSTVVGTVTVEPDGDPDFWTPAERAEPALYVSKLVVARSHAGQRLGEALLEWTRETAASQGRTWVRLDAWRSNDQLRSYYTSRGWEWLRDVADVGRSSGALFQKPAGPMPRELRQLFTSLVPEKCESSSGAPGAPDSRS